MVPKFYCYAYNREAGFPITSKIPMRKEVFFWISISTTEKKNLLISLDYEKMRGNLQNHVTSGSSENLFFKGYNPELK